MLIYLLLEKKEYIDGIDLANIIAPIYLLLDYYSKNMAKLQIIEIKPNQGSKLMLRY